MLEICFVAGIALDFANTGTHVFEFNGFDASIHEDSYVYVFGGSFTGSISSLMIWNNGECISECLVFGRKI